ncbi:hypothetical protein VPNG_01721 [Cytospora leucostoma]|uniref:Prolyl 4-hydroxylase alpha subunit Fe(2+) 2OG dioxygenase domain-containing protein n=1 Tax=Cytospora leucostoma TaxID=1230097 RepID=A0A423XKS8_9PEZI|nr:hypothetical protein VPNG_01721 [Cytospora leucostoma]
MPEQGIIPSIQRSVRNGIGYAGDAAGNIVNANGKAIQDAAWAAGRRADGVARSLSGSGKAAGKGVGSRSQSAGAYVQGAGKGLGKQVEGCAGYAGRQVGAVGRYVDGGGRAAGGRVGDLGNSVKDKSCAKGKRMTEQLLQEAAMNDAANSPHEPVSSASGEADITTASEAEAEPIASAHDANIDDGGPHLSAQSAKDDTSSYTDDMNGIAPDDNREFDFTELKEDLLEAIDGIHAFGPFSAGGSLAMVTGLSSTDPEIWIRDVGAIELPLDDAQAQRIMHKAQQSTLDRDREINTNASVSNPWELRPEEFEIRDPYWASLTQGAMPWVKQKLGLEGDISARLDKMLLYDKTSVPRPDPDTDKPPGAFGTLTISLPSLHEGGNLVLTHGTDTEVYKSSGGQGLVACWYSDVGHQVLPVTSGYRWFLTYTLIHPPGMERPSAQRISDGLLPLRRVLQRWSEEGDLTEYGHVFYMLQDQDTYENPSFKNLRGREGMQMRALEEVAASSECELFLALLEKKTETRDERPYHKAWYHDKEEDDEEEDDEEEDYEEEDEEEGEDESVPVAEARVSMRSLVNLRDRELISEYTFGDESECVEVILQGEDAFDAVEPDVEYDYDGALDEIYTMMAVVIVPRQHAVKFFQEHMESPPSGPLLRYFAKKCCKADTRASALPVFKRAFREILEQWVFRDALSDTLHVALSADAQLFNDFIKVVREPVPSQTLTLLRKMLQMGHVKFDEVKQSLIPLFERRLDDRDVTFSLSALIAFSHNVLDGTLPRREGLGTFRRLSKLLVEKLDFRDKIILPPAAQEPPARRARHTYDTSQSRAPAYPDLDDGLADVPPELLAGFLDALILSESDEIIVHFGFKILGQIRDVCRQRLERIWLPFVQRLLNILEVNRIPLSTTRYQCIVGGILDAYLDKTVGKEPQASQGSLYRQPVQCRRRRRTCPECNMLNGFLVDSSLLQTRLSSPGTHLEEQLRLLSGCTYTLEYQTIGTAWLIVKTPTQDPQRDGWEKCCNHAQEVIREIDQSKLAAVLGDTDYRRITTMSHLRCTPVAPASVPNVSSTSIQTPVAGDQQSTIPGPGGWGIGAKSLMPAGYKRPQPARVAGVKRPAPPSDQVIDLTWMD